MNASICAVILTLNEENNLPRCYDSLRWCDDIVVLDSESSDNTLQAAKKLGARTYTHKQTGTFLITEQRNHALRHCNIKATWVLFLDADETIPPDLARHIRQACSDSPHNAYELTPRYLFWGKWLKRTQGYPNWHCRLLKRGEVWFEGGVWESFSKDARIGKIHLPYDHYANSKGLSDWLERHDRYSSWDARKICDFLQSRGESATLGTRRKARLRYWAARLWPIRPLARFLQMYLLRAGFLEGWQSLCFCLLYSFYEFMIVCKIIELKRHRQNLPL